MSKVTIKDGARLAFGCAHIVIEIPAEVRDGNYDIDEIGAFSYMGGGHTVVRHVSKIGRFCSIAPNVAIGLIQHPTDFVSTHDVFRGHGSKQFSSKELKEYFRDNRNEIDLAASLWEQRARSSKIEIGNDVWIGEGATIARGVTIGDGSVIAGRAYVNRDVEPYTVVGGIPARMLKQRFTNDVTASLKRLRWFDYGLRALNGAPMHAPEEAVKIIEDNVSRLELYRPERVQWTGQNGSVAKMPF